MSKIRVKSKKYREAFAAMYCEGISTVRNLFEAVAIYKRTCARLAIKPDNVLSHRCVVLQPTVSAVGDLKVGRYLLCDRIQQVATITTTGEVLLLVKDTRILIGDESEYEST